MLNTFRRGATWVLVGLLCATSLVVVLALQLRSARAAYAALQKQGWVLSSGMYLPRLDLELVDGNRAIIGAAPVGSWQVLFLYNTTCGFCRASLPAWQEVTRRVTGPRVQVYGLSLDSRQATQTFGAEHHLTFPSALLVDRRSKALLRADAVPQTIVIDADGQVLFGRPGTLTAAGADSVIAVVSDSVPNNRR